METRKAIIYARVSTEQGDRQSTDRQVIDLSEYADTAGYEVVKVYSEKISGAKRNSERVGLQAAIKYAIDNETTVLVSELSRLGRNAFEVIETCKTLIDAKVDVYLQKEQLHLLDTDSKVGVLVPVMLATLATCAQLERESIQFRLNSGRAQYIANGGKLGRKVGFRKSEEDYRDQYRKELRLLRAGHSLRNTHAITGTSIQTLRKLKAYV